MLMWLQTGKHRWSLGRDVVAQIVTPLWFGKPAYESKVPNHPLFEEEDFISFLNECLISIEKCCERSFASMLSSGWYNHWEEEYYKGKDPNRALPCYPIDKDHCVQALKDLKLAGSLSVVNEFFVVSPPF